MKNYPYGLDPRLRDTDGDGYDDDEEIVAGMDPTQPDPAPSAAGNEITSAYDALDRLTRRAAHESGGSLESREHFAYDAACNLTNTTSPNGITDTAAFDISGRLTAYANPASSRVFAYAAADRRIRDDILAGTTPAPTRIRYAQNTFDAADRLLAAQVRYGSHTNDAIEEAYLHDANGAVTNIISVDASILTASYNAFGRLTATANDQQPTANYSYDALGNRVIANGVILFPDYADPLKRPLIEADAATGEPLRYYIWAGGRLLGYVDAQTDTLTIAHSDNFGSVAALTDETGNTIHTAHYGPTAKTGAAQAPTPRPSHG